MKRVEMGTRHGRDYGTATSVREQVRRSPTEVLKRQREGIGRGLTAICEAPLYPDQKLQTLRLLSEDYSTRAQATSPHTDKSMKPKLWELVADLNGSIMDLVVEQVREGANPRAVEVINGIVQHVRKLADTYGDDYNGVVSTLAPFMDSLENPSKATPAEEKPVVVKTAIVAREVKPIRPQIIPAGYGPTVGRLLDKFSNGQVLFRNSPTPLGEEN